MILYLILYVQTLLCAYWLMRYYVKPVRVRFLVDSLRFNKLITALTIVTLNIQALLLIVECVIFDIFTIYDIIYTCVNFVCFLVYSVYNIDKIVDEWQNLNKCLSL